MTIETIGDIVSGLSKVSDSLNGVKNEFSGMKVQQKNMDDSVKELSSEVKKMGENINSLEGKTKGLRADINRVEKSFSREISNLKKDDVPLIARDEISQVIQLHEDRFPHRPKSSNSSSSIRKPTEEKIAVPKWLLFAGLFFGSALVGGGMLLIKFL